MLSFLVSILLAASPAPAGNESAARSALPAQEPDSGAGAADAMARARELGATARATAEPAGARRQAGLAIEVLLGIPAEDCGAECTALLRDLGSLAYQHGDLETARSARERVLSILEATRPELDPDRIEAASQLAATLAGQGETVRALALFEGVLAGRRATLPEGDARVLSAMFSVASCLSELRQLDRALALQEEVVATREARMPDDAVGLARARLGLASTHYRRNEFDAARALQEKCVAALEALPGGEAEEVRNLLRHARSNLAITLFEFGNLTAARDLQEVVLLDCQRTLPEDNLELARARQGLANTVASLGDLSRARALEERVLAAYAALLPEDHDAVVRARANLAATLSQLGDLAAARVLLERVLAVRQRKLPAGHPDIARAQANLANVLQVQGDLEGALALQESVLQVFERVLPEGHPLRVGARSNLARTLYLMGRDERAIGIQEDVLAIRARTLPAGHPDIDAARLNLANTLFRAGTTERALELRREVLDSTLKSLTESNPFLISARTGLSRSLLAAGDLAGAREQAEAALRGSVLVPGEDGADADSARMCLLWILALESRTAAGSDESGARAGARERFAAEARTLVETARRRIELLLLESSPREAEERVASLRASVSLALWAAAGGDVFPPDPALLAETFLLVEEGRAAAVTSARIASAARGAPDFEALRRAVHDATANLARLAQSGADSRALSEARVVLDAAQRALVVRGAALGGARRSADQGLRALVAALGPGVALVSFTRYDALHVTSVDPPDLGGFEGFSAFVVRAGPDGSPVVTWHHLGSADRIAAAAGAWRTALLASRARGIAQGEDAGAAEPRLGAELRALVLDPLRVDLAGVGRIVAVLDDVLHTVPVDALPAGDPWGGPDAGDRRLGDVLRADLRSSLLEPAAPRALDSPPRGLLALGHPAFDSDPEEAPSAPVSENADEGGGARPAEAAAARSPAVAGVLRGGAWERGFATLPATRDEVRAIGQYFEEAFGDEAPAVVLTRRAASRQSLVDNAPRARWLHVATHGWFAPESVRSTADPGDRSGAAALVSSAEERVRGSSPLLLAGLALSGANLPADGFGRIPGLVTAEEVAALDLSACELAVLSACDTNVGLRRAGQGVASLQRALHMAGARSVITSLWKVSDEATRDLMTDFYRRLWIQSKPRHQALWETKRRMREARDESGAPLYSTRDWAAWVLTGEAG